VLGDESLHLLGAIQNDCPERFRGSVGSVKPGLSSYPARPSCKPGRDIACWSWRSLATSGLCCSSGRARSEAGLVSLRPSESRRVGMERVQSWRVRPGRWRNCADTCPERFRGKCRLCEAGLFAFPQRGALATSSSCLTPRLKIIRQPERLECANDIQTPETVQRTRGVAKGTPRMTSVNQRWRAGARQQTALAGCEGMSVRHPRVRPHRSQMETVIGCAVRGG
jgi:hypothetical protein